MADTGGGGGWSVTEVIIVVILCAALLSQIVGKPIQPIFGPADQSGSKEETLAAGDCKVLVERPRPLEVIEGYVTISGATRGCVTLTQNKAPTITAVVVDDAGMPLSNVIKLSETTSQDGYSPEFLGATTLSRVPYSKRGYVIISTSGFTESEGNSRVPVRFK